MGRFMAGFYSILDTYILRYWNLRLLRELSLEFVTRKLIWIIWVTPSIHRWLKSGMYWLLEHWVLCPAPGSRSVQTSEKGLRGRRRLVCMEHSRRTRVCACVLEISPFTRILLGRQSEKIGCLLDWLEFQDLKIIAIKTIWTTKVAFVTSL